MRKIKLQIALSASLVVALFGASSLIASSASADEQAPVAQHRSQRGVIDLPPTEITSPPMRPLASVDIARIEPRLTLFVLRQAFMTRIENAIYSDRF